MVCIVPRPFVPQGDTGKEILRASEDVPKSIGITLSYYEIVSSSYDFGMTTFP
ncbi:hypothetical protein [Sphingobacterium mizutaii]|uniref:hypothetical protein n=1 Tax=Sphingobacterium mizutaii TaxID=1010 RepID=UPI0016295685|nr:hypothetical protein [Sphingobacterium mizutaii]